MANHFNEMSQVVDSLDLMRDVLTNSVKPYKINATRGGKKLVEKIKYGGRQITNDSYIDVSTSNLLTKFDEYISMQVYGEYSKDAGSVNIGNKQVSVTKAARLLGTLTSLNGMALNLPAGVSNVLNNKIQTRIEAIGREFFTPKDMLWADAK
jgi:hypothetical protein